MPLVSIITVNYNGAKLTCEMIKSLKSISYSNIEIIVVDNASTESTNEISKKFPEIQLIKSKQNLGFAGGNNLGIRASKGEYILLLNNDTEVDKNFLEPLVEKLISDPTIGAVSPKVYYYDTCILQFAGAKAINPITGRGGFVGDLEIDCGQHDKATKCSHTHGAAMLIPRNVLKKVGLMSEIYFLYYEELDFCEKIKRAGYSFWYIPKSEVYHKESMSVGKKSALKTYYITRNRILFMKRNVSLIKYISFLIFYIFIVIPKSILLYIIYFEFSQIIPFIKGICWHLTIKDFVPDPKL